MAQIISISLTLEDFEFVKQQQKRGLSPSKVFQDALSRIRRQVNEGIDLSEVAIAAKFDRYQQLLQKLYGFLDDRGLQNDFLEFESKGRAEIEGVPEPKTGDSRATNGSEEVKK